MYSFPAFTSLFRWCGLKSLSLEFLTSSFGRLFFLGCHTIGFFFFRGLLSSCLFLMHPHWIYEAQFTSLYLPLIL